MIEGLTKLSTREQRHPEGVMRLQHQCAITGTLGKPQEVLSKRVSSGELSASPVVQPEAPERREELGSIPDLQGKRVCASVGALDLEGGPAADGPQLATERDLQGELLLDPPRLCRDGLNKADRSLDVRDGFSGSVPPDGVLPGLVQVTDGSLVVAPPLEMHRELGGDLPRPLTVAGFDTQAHSSVKRRPAPRGDALVEHLTVERMEEGIARRDRAIRPLLRSARPEELLAPRETRAARLDLHAAPLDAGRHRRRGEFGPGHARHLQDVPVGGAEPIELALDHRADIHRDVDGHGLGRYAEPPPPSALDENAPRDQVVGDIHHEEGIAVAAGVDLSGQASHRRGELCSDGKPPDEILLHGRSTETVQGELPTEPVKLKLVLDPPEPMFLRQHLHRSIGAEHQEPRPLRPPPEEREPVQRGRIAPMQVLEPQDQRGVEREGLQGLGQLAEHALPRVRLRSLLESPSLAGADQGRHLDQPRGGVPGEDPTDGVTVRLAAEPGQGIEDRQVGFSRAVVVDALPPTDPDRGGRRDLGHERLDHRRLADPRLARDEDDLALALTGLGEPSVELLKLQLTADRRGGRRRANAQ